MGDENAFLIELDMYPPESNDAALLQMVAGVHNFVLIEPTMGGGLVTLRVTSSGLDPDREKLAEFLAHVSKELRELASEE